MVRATATDSAQPISNALYAPVGSCRACRSSEPDRRAPSDPRRSARCRPGSSRSPSTSSRPGSAEGQGTPGAGRTRPTPALDRGPLRSASPTRSTIGSCGRSPAAAGCTAARTGRRSATAMPARPVAVGPVAARDAALLAPILGHLTSAVVPRGAFAMWVGGAADRALVPALRAGFRLDQFPVLLCWDRPFADFSATCRSRRAAVSAARDDGPVRHWPPWSLRISARVVASASMWLPCRARGRSRATLSMSDDRRRQPRPRSRM